MYSNRSKDKKFGGREKRINYKKYNHVDPAYIWSSYNYVNFQTSSQTKSSSSSGYAFPSRRTTRKANRKLSQQLRRERASSPLNGSEEYTQRKIQETSDMIKRQLMGSDNTPLIDNATNKISHQKHKSTRGPEIKKLPSPNTKNKGSDTIKDSKKGMSKKNRKAALRKKFEKESKRYNVEEIHNQIMNHISKLNHGRKQNFINADTTNYDAAIQLIYKQKSLELSKALREMSHQEKPEASDVLNSIIPDFAIKFEELPIEIIRALSSSFEKNVGEYNNIFDHIASCSETVSPIQDRRHLSENIHLNTNSNQVFDLTDLPTSISNNMNERTSHIDCGDTSLIVKDEGVLVVEPYELNEPTFNQQALEKSFETNNDIISHPEKANAALVLRDESSFVIPENPRTLSRDTQADGLPRPAIGSVRVCTNLFEKPQSNIEIQTKHNDSSELVVTNDEINSPQDLMDWGDQLENIYNNPKDKHVLTDSNNIKGLATNETSSNMNGGPPLGSLRVSTNLFERPPLIIPSKDHDRIMSGVNIETQDLPVPNNAINIYENLNESKSKNSEDLLKDQHRIHQLSTGEANTEETPGTIENFSQGEKSFVGSLRVSTSIFENSRPTTSLREPNDNMEIKFTRPSSYISSFSNEFDIPNIHNNIDLGNKRDHPQEINYKVNQLPDDRQNMGEIPIPVFPHHSLPNENITTCQKNCDNQLNLNKIHESTIGTFHTQHLMPKEHFRKNTHTNTELVRIESDMNTQQKCNSNNVSNLPTHSSPKVNQSSQNNPSILVDKANLVKENLKINDPVLCEQMISAPNHKELNEISENQNKVPSTDVKSDKKQAEKQKCKGWKNHNKATNFACQKSKSNGIKERDRSNEEYKNTINKIDADIGEEMGGKIKISYSETNTSCNSADKTSQNEMDLSYKSKSASNINYNYPQTSLNKHIRVAVEVLTSPKTLIDGKEMMLEIDREISKLTELRQKVILNLIESAENNVLKDLEEPRGVKRKRDNESSEIITKKKVDEMPSMKSNTISHDDQVNNKNRSLDHKTTESGRNEKYSTKGRKEKNIQEPHIKEVANESRNTTSCDTIEIEDDPEEILLDANKLSGSVLEYKVIVNQHMLILGTDNGKIHYFNLHKRKLILSVEISRSPITCLEYSIRNNKIYLYTGTSQEKHISQLRYKKKSFEKRVALEDSINIMRSSWGYFFIGGPRGYLTRYNHERGAIDYEDRISEMSIKDIRTSREGVARILVILFKDANGNNHIHVRNAISGLHLRTIGDEKNVNCIVLQDSFVYVTSNEDIFVYNFCDGESVFKFSLFADRWIKTMMALENLLFLGSSDGVYVYNMKNRKYLGHLSCDKISSMSVLENRLLLGTRSKKLISMKIPAYMRDVQKR